MTSAAARKSMPICFSGQTAGVTDSEKDVLPGWRQFFINDIADPGLASRGAPFAITSDYNPNKCENPIAKV
jgi:hypothetical protein